jgi:hypothetical protein
MIESDAKRYGRRSVWSYNKIGLGLILDLDRVWVKIGFR